MTTSASTNAIAVLNPANISDLQHMYNALDMLRVLLRVVLILDSVQLAKNGCRYYKCNIHMIQLRKNGN